MIDDSLHVGALGIDHVREAPTSFLFTIESLSFTLTPSVSQRASSLFSTRESVTQSFAWLLLSYLYHPIITTEGVRVDNR